MRFNLIIISVLLILSSTISTANPGGKGDDVRDLEIVQVLAIPLHLLTANQVLPLPLSSLTKFTQAYFLT